MEGSNLPIHYTALTAGSQIITNYKTDIHVSRSLTRLKAVFVTLYKSPVTRVREDGECNVFYHPMGDAVTPFQQTLLLLILARNSHSKFKSEVNYTQNIQLIVHLKCFTNYEKHSGYILVLIQLTQTVILIYHVILLWQLIWKRCLVHLSVE